MLATIRLAAETDAAQIREIYAPIVRETIISFEIEPPAIAEMRHRIAETVDAYPWLCCEKDGVLWGYAYATKHRARAAYQWCVEVSVYIHHNWRRAGVGRALYTSLFAVLKLQGFCNAYAGIALPNPASVALHESLGFRPVGVYRNVGFKLGGWHDVGWWQFALLPHSPDPTPPAPLAAVISSPAWHDALAAGLPYLRVPSPAQ